MMGTLEKWMRGLNARRGIRDRCAFVLPVVLALAASGCATTRGTSGSAVSSGHDKDTAEVPAPVEAVTDQEREGNEETGSVRPSVLDGAEVRERLATIESVGDPEAYRALSADLNRMADEGLGTSSAFVARYDAGVAAERAGDEVEAERAYRAVLESSDADPTLSKAARRALIRLYLNRGQVDDARRVARHWIESAPDDIDARNYMAIVEGAAGDYDRAEKRLQDVLKRDARNTGAYRSLARLHYEQGHYQLSILLAANALKVGGEDAGVRNNMGVTSLALGDETVAIESFRKAIELQEEHVQANLNLGLIALRSGDYELATTAFERVRRRSPRNVDAALGLAVALRGRMEYDAALKLYEEVLAQSEDNFIALYNLGIVHGKYLHDFDKSLQYLERCDRLARTPDDRTRVEEKINEIKQARDEYRRIQREEAERLAREKAEAEERERRRQEEQRALKQAHDRLQSRIQEVEKLIEKSGASHSDEELEPIRTALQQSKMVLEMDDADLMGDALEVLDSAARAIEP